MSRLYIILIFTIITVYGVAETQTINIVTDNNMWYPFSYEENNRSKGLHIDVVKMALENLGYNTALTPLPWKRALITAKNGEFDAVIGASYKAERTQYLNYPKDASLPGKSEYRITQVEYSIVTNIEDSYEYDGNVHTLPRPILAPVGYSIVDDIRDEGVPVVEVADINKRFKILLLRKGCIITLPQIVHMYMEQEEYSDKFHISEIPFKSKSYFLVFSKRSSISESSQQEIWEEIRRIREDSELMEKLYNKY